MDEEKTLVKKSKTPSTAKKSVDKVATKTESAGKTKTKKSAAALMRVQQIKSPIGREKWQRQVLIGLGLNKMHRIRELEDTPATRGMVEKVSHLVKVIH